MCRICECPNVSGTIWDTQNERQRDHPHGDVDMPVTSSEGAYFLAVVDRAGHGEHGDMASDFVMNELPGCLAAHPALVADPPTALKEAYIKVDDCLTRAKVL